MKWYIMVLKKYAVFTGRARRKEYWMFVLFTVIFSIAARLLDWLLGLNTGVSAMSGGWLTNIYALAVLIPSLAVVVRRFHDIGKSGWVYARFAIFGVLLTFIFIGYMVYTMLSGGGGLEALKRGDIDPSVFTGTFAVVVVAFVLILFVMCVWIIVLLCRDSQPHDNKWGPNPKAGELPAA